MLLIFRWFWAALPPPFTSVHATVSQRVINVVISQIP